jgi:hypothetical protein
MVVPFFMPSRTLDHALCPETTAAGRRRAVKTIRQVGAGILTAAALGAGRKSKLVQPFTVSYILRVQP